MCGILGIINREQPVDAEAFNAGLNRLSRRGPDDHGVWQNPEQTICLGHRRLAILDITSAGHQPMESKCKPYVITYNGEVYNFRELRQELIEKGHAFDSESDTEVILASYQEWGEDCVQRFNGMFAFALYDGDADKLFCARDRVGIKPFYYRQTATSFAFASRPGALTTALTKESGEYDLQSIRYYLEGGYIPGEASIFSGVKKLLPGHTLSIDIASLAGDPKCYWDVRQFEIDASLHSCDEEKLLDELDDLLTASVRERMIADVPLGAFLSGGFDSSLVVSIMQKLSDVPIKTFTIGFDEEDSDESVHAEAVAKHLGTEHYCERLAAEDLLALMDEFFSQYDEPLADHAAFPLMAISRMTRKHVTVALTGDGGDELFGGYHYYQIIKNLAPVFHVPQPIRAIAGAVLKKTSSHKLRLLGGAIGRDSLPAAFAFSRSIIKNHEDLITPELRACTQGMAEVYAENSARLRGSMTAADMGMRNDFSLTLVDDYLQKVDVGSMAFSLEARVPLLDHRLVEWSMALPLRYKLRGNTSKYLLRKLCYRYIPREIMDRPKRGFGVPMRTWLRGPLQAWADTRIHDSMLFDRLPLRQPDVIDLWSEFKRGANDSDPLIWAILVLLEFRRRAA